MSNRARRRILSKTRSKSPHHVIGKKPSTLDLIGNIASKTAVIAGIVAVTTIGYTLWELWAANGKVVILPFELKGDLDGKQNLGESVSSGISRSIDNLNYIYRSSFDVGSAQRPKLEVISAYLSDLPLSSIPHSVSIAQATTLTSLSMFGIQVPFGQLIFKNLAFFHKDYVSGTIESWNGDIIADVHLGDGESFTLTSDKTKGFLWLIDMISSEVLNRERWLNLPPIKTPSVMYFTRGVSDYINYQQFGDQSLLDSARQNYKIAVESDPSFSLARLHLAVTQYDSWNNADLLSSIINFSLLSSIPEFQFKAKIGLAAALLRHIERNRDCQTYDRDLGRASAIISDLSKGYADTVELLVLKASVMHKRISRVLNNAECRKERGSSIGLMPSTFDALESYNTVSSEYDEALYRLVKEGAQDYRNLSILANKKYTLDDTADYLIRSDRLDEASATLGKSLAVSRIIRDDGKYIPSWQFRKMYPFMKGSYAETDLKIAFVQSKKLQAFDTELVDAEEQLKGLVYDEEPRASKWALGRMAELYLSEGRIGEMEDALQEFFNFQKDEKSRINYFRDESTQYSVFAVDDRRVCEFIDGLNDLISFDERSVLGRLLLAELYYQYGDVALAKRSLQAAKFAKENNFLWYGDTTQRELDSLEIKVAAESGNTGDAEVEFWKSLSDRGVEPKRYEDWLKSLSNYEFVLVVSAAEALSTFSAVQDVLNVAKRVHPELSELVGAQGKTTKLPCKI